MKRTFIAIKIQLEKQKQEILFDIQQQLKDEKIKWVDFWNMHITLFFLGDTEEDTIPDISNEIRAQLERIKPFQLKLNGIGVFRSLRDPKVIWIGIKESGSLKVLKKKIDDVVVPFGFLIDKRDYKPHLTLGRVKLLKNKSNLKKVLDSYENYDFGKMDVEQVIFYESKLTPKGPVYKVMNQFNLG